MTGWRKLSRESLFAVAQSPGSDAAIVLYRNNNGTAERMAEIGSSRKISEIGERVAAGPDGSLIVQAENGPIMVITNDGTANFVELKSAYGYQLPLLSGMVKNRHGVERWRVGCAGHKDRQRAAHC